MEISAHCINWQAHRCSWTDSVQTRYGSYHWPLRFGSRLNDPDPDLRSQGCKTAEVAAQMISQSSLTIRMDFGVLFDFCFDDAHTHLFSSSRVKSPAQMIPTQKQRNNYTSKLKLWLVFGHFFQIWFDNKHHWNGLIDLERPWLEWPIHEWPWLSFRKNLLISFCPKFLYRF